MQWRCAMTAASGVRYASAGGRHCVVSHSSGNSKNTLQWRCTMTAASEVRYASAGGVGRIAGCRQVYEASCKNKPPHALEKSIKGRWPQLPPGPTGCCPSGRQCCPTAVEGQEAASSWCAPALETLGCNMIGCLRSIDDSHHQHRRPTRGQGLGWPSG